MPDDGPPKALLDLEVESRRELDGAQLPHRVLSEADVRIPDGSHGARLNVREAVHEVHDLPGVDVVKESVDREISTKCVVGSRPEHVVVGDQQVVAVSAHRLGRLSKRRDLDDLVVSIHDVDELKASTDDAAVAKNPPDFSRLRRRGDVEVLRTNVQEQVSNTAPYQVGLVLEAAEASHHLDDGRVEGAGGDRLVDPLRVRRVGHRKTDSTGDLAAQARFRRPLEIVAACVTIDYTGVSVG